MKNKHKTHKLKRKNVYIPLFSDGMIICTEKTKESTTKNNPDLIYEFNSDSQKLMCEFN